jgi:hypothetical protein
MWVELRDWEATLKKVIPMRKFESTSRAHRGSRNAAEEAGEGGGDEEEGQNDEEESGIQGQEGVEEVMALTEEEMMMNA